MGRDEGSDQEGNSKMKKRRERELIYIGGERDSWKEGEREIRRR